MVNDDARPTRILFVVCSETFTYVNIENTWLFGSLLAPRSTVTVTNSQVYGFITAAAMTVTSSSLKAGKIGSGLYPGRRKSENWSPEKGCLLGCTHGAMYQSFDTYNSCTFDGPDTDESSSSSSSTGVSYVDDDDDTSSS